MRARIITSGHLVCYINGKPLGGVFSFTYHSETPRRLSKGIDSILPYELIQQSPSTIGQVSLWRSILDGGLEGQGLIALPEDLAKEKYFSISIVERSSDTVVFRSDYCSVLSQQWGAQPRNMMFGNFTFQCIDYYNESKTS